MKRRSRRNHSPAFEAKVALAVIKSDRTIVQLADHFDVHPQPDHSAEIAALKAASPRFFGSGGAAAVPAIDVRSLHAKIGELTLENDLLEGALTKAGLLGAKR
ncbi:hypothetical protein IVB27_19895 [Bradyrhizobium sp. 197]|nr:hypothetical protein [Bradyrhizobium sp. 197]